MVAAGSARALPRQSAAQSPSFTLRRCMRPPVRLLALLACLLAMAGLVGCGSDEAGGPLDGSLGYLPKDAPFAVAVDTDVDGDQYQALNALFQKFPLGDADQGDRAAATLAKEATGVDLQKDVVPLLGNPFVVGAADAASFLGGSDGNGFVAAIEVSDEDKLGDLLEKRRRRREGRAVRGQDLRRRRHRVRGRRRHGRVRRLAQSS